MGVLHALLAPKFWVVDAWLAAAAMVHFRGKVRHGFARQLTDHSTFLAPYNALVYLFSAVPNRPYLDLADFPELAPLRENWEMIRDEARALLDGGHVRAAEKRDDIAFNTFFRRGWKRFYLKWYGEMTPTGRALCPKTCALVESIPSLNAALFTLLPAGSKLGKHRDPFAGSLRYHLGIITPNDDRCFIDVDGEVHSWRDGKDVLFDETYIHYARNDTATDRLIFFCDVARPLRTPVMRALNGFVSRRLAKITASRNTEQEKLGIVNRIARPIHVFQARMRKLKKANRRLYYAGKYAVLAALFYLVFFVVL